MKKSVKALIILNILYYSSCFLYIYKQSTMEIKGLWSFIAFFPHFLVVFSAFIVFPSEKNKFKIIRTEAVMDLILRIIAFFVNFRITGLEKFSLWFNLIIVSIIILFMLNLLLEGLMYKKVSLHNESNNVKFYDFSFEDRKNYNDMSRAVLREALEIPILIIIITTILGFKNSSSTSSIIGLSIIDVLLLNYFLRHSYESLSLFYKDKVIAKKYFVKENKFILLNIFIGAILATVRILGYNFVAFVDFILFFLQMSIICPNFIARNKRAVKVYEIRKAKGNN